MYLEFLEEQLLYTHKDSIRESIINYKGKLVIVALKTTYRDMARNEKTGEEIPFKETFSNQYGKGDSFEFLGTKQTGYHILIPGIVEALKFKTDDEGRKVTKIKRLIWESERPELEKIIRDYRYKGNITYWEVERLL